MITEDCGNSEDDCQLLDCQHQGICTIGEGDPVEAGKVKAPAYCQCPLGFDGEFCETPVEITVHIE